MTDRKENLLIRLQRAYQTEYEFQNPWPIKKLSISLGGEDDLNGFLNLEYFNQDTFTIEIENAYKAAYHSITIEDIDSHVLRLLRDFLIYCDLGDVKPPILGENACTAGD